MNPEDLKETCTLRSVSSGARNGATSLMTLLMAAWISWCTRAAKERRESIRHRIRSGDASWGRSSTWSTSQITWFNSGSRDVSRLMDASVASEASLHRFTYSCRSGRLVGSGRPSQRRHQLSLINSLLYMYVNKSKSLVINWTYQSIYKIVANYQYTIIYQSIAPVVVGIWSQLALAPAQNVHQSGSLSGTS